MTQNLQTKDNIFFKLALLVFAIVLIARIFLVFNIPYFSSEKSYGNARIATQIASEGKFSQDNLIQEGKEVYFVSFSNYLLAFFTKFMDVTTAGKIINEIIISLFVILTYLITKEITNNPKSAFIASLFSSAIPYLIKTITNTYEIHTLGFLLIFTLILTFLKAKNKKQKYIIIYLGAFILAIITTQVTIIFSISLLTYYLISIVYNKKLDSYEKEIIFFTIFSNIICSFLILKKVLISEGFQTIWQNIPAEILPVWYPKFSIIYIAYLLGLSTVVLATRIIYKNLIKTQNKNFFLIFSIIFTTFILLWTKLIRFNVGMMLIALILPIVVGYFFDDFEKYLKNTRASRKTAIIITTLTIISLFLANLIPTIQTATEIKSIITDKDVEALQWLKENSNSSDIIYSEYNYGNIITYYSNRKIIASSDFVGIDNINTIISDINQIKKSRIKTTVIELLNKYNVSYLVLNKELDETTFNNEIFKSTCFEEKFNNEKIKILKLKCHITK